MNNQNNNNNNQTDQQKFINKYKEKIFYNEKNDDYNFKCLCGDVISSDDQNALLPKIFKRHLLLCSDLTNDFDKIEEEVNILNNAIEEEDEFNFLTKIDIINNFKPIKKAINKNNYVSDEFLKTTKEYNKVYKSRISKIKNDLKNSSKKINDVLKNKNMELGISLFSQKALNIFNRSNFSNFFKDYTLILKHKYLILDITNEKNTTNLFNLLLNPTNNIIKYNFLQYIYYLILLNLKKMENIKLGLLIDFIIYDSTISDFRNLPIRCKNFININISKLIYDKLITEKDIKYLLRDFTNLKYNNLLAYLKNIIFNLFDEIMQIAVSHEFNQSNFCFVGIYAIQLKIMQSTPLAASSYIELPNKLKNKKCLINIKNFDSECLKYVVMCSLARPEHDADRISKYLPNSLHYNQNKDLYDKINLIFSKYPIPFQLNYLDDLTKELSNELNQKIYINVYNYRFSKFDNRKKFEYNTFICKDLNFIEKLDLDIKKDYNRLNNLKNQFNKALNLNMPYSFAPCELFDLPYESKPKINSLVYQTNGIKISENDKLINVLYYSKKQFDHFILINDLNRLLNSDGQQYIYCQYCLNPFRPNSKKYKNHICDASEKIKLPTKSNNKLVFNKFNTMQDNPITITADFEAILLNINEENDYVNNTNKIIELEEIIKLYNNQINLNPNNSKRLIEEVKRKNILIEKLKVKVANFDNYIKTIDEYNEKIKTALDVNDYEKANLFMNDYNKFKNGKQNMKFNNSHNAISFGYAINDKYKLLNSTNFSYNKTGIVIDSENVEFKAIEILANMTNEIYKVLKNTNYNIDMNESDNENYDKSNICYICNTLFNKDVIKVRDHNHFLKNNNFRGAACQNCNLLLKKNNKINVFLHNFTGYDSHFIIKGLSQYIKNYKSNKKINCINLNTQKIKTLNFDKMCFIDSLSLLGGGSLSELVEQNTFLDGKFCNELAKTNLKFTLNNLKNVYSNIDFSNVLELVLCKGSFPYEWFNDSIKLDFTEIPKINDFNSMLKNYKMTDVEYSNFKNIYSNILQCETFTDYHNFYLNLDCWLLNDILENYFKFTLSTYGINAYYYLSAAQLTYNNALLNFQLKNQNKNIELITDINIYNLIKECKTGGLTVNNSKYVKANNPYLSDYDNTQLTKYLIYLDANNLYGKSLTKKLPIGEFKDLENVNVALLKKILNGYNEDGDFSYFVKYSGYYPDSVHDKLKDLPPLIINKAISLKEQSEFQINQLITENINFNVSTGDIGAKKLISDLTPKNNISTHINNLKIAVDLGFIITDVVQIVQYKQEYIFKDYVELNTSLRSKAKTEFEKSIFKLFNNSLFGRTIMSQEEFSKTTFITNDIQAKKKIFRNQIKDFTVINQDLILLDLFKNETIINTPVAIGAFILQDSKFNMVNAYYNTFKSLNKNLVYMDTDSFVFETSENPYEFIKNNHDNIFDCSEYSEDHPEFKNLFNKSNAKKLMFFKDENKNNVINEFVAPNPKNYSVLTSNNKNIMKAKGTSKTVIKKGELIHLDFLNCINKNIKKFTKNISIKSFNHEIFTNTVIKQSLNTYSNKRCFINSIDSLPYGHYKLNQINNKYKNLNFQDIKILQNNYKQNVKKN